MSSNWKLNWTSSDPTIASVNENGLVTANVDGKAIVTCNVGSISDSVNINVKSQLPPPIITDPMPYLQNWQKHTVLINNYDIQRCYRLVDYSPELSLFIAYNRGNNNGIGGTSILQSKDGISWVEKTDVLPSANTWVDSVWSHKLSLFCACAQRTNNGNAGLKEIAVSSNGNIWEKRDLPENLPLGPWVDGLGEWSTIYYSSDIDKIFCFDAYNIRMASSSDSINWNDNKLVGQFINKASGYVYDGSLYGQMQYYSELQKVIFVSECDIFTSNDGFNWENKWSVNMDGDDNISGNMATKNTFCYAPKINTFLVLSLDEYSYKISKDNGDTWFIMDSLPVLVNDRGEREYWCSFCWSPTLNAFVAATNKGSIASSLNGETWTMQRISKDIYDCSNSVSIVWSEKLGYFTIYSWLESFDTTPFVYTLNTYTSPSVYQ